MQEANTGVICPSYTHILQNKSPLATLNSEADVFSSHCILLAIVWDVTDWHCWKNCNKIATGLEQMW